jgi:hypothetical protein
LALLPGTTDSEAQKLAGNGSSYAVSEYLMKTISSRRPMLLGLENTTVTAEYMRESSRIYNSH